MPSKRRAAWLVIAETDTLSIPECQFVDALMTTCPALGRVIELARTFRTMVRQQHEAMLETWLPAAKETALAGFAEGLVRDRVAVRAALALPWSTGPVEGESAD